MASSAKPDLWSDLSGLGRPETTGPDARAALLRVNAEMFVAAPARDREIIETFEALALGFLPRADRATLVDLARILAPCEDAPASVLDYLARHSPDAREIVLRHAHRLPSTLDARLLATAEGRLRLASSPALDAATIERLLVLRENVIEDALAANPHLAPAGPVFEELARRAQARPALARILLDRNDLPAAEEASLYWAAGPERRRHIRSRIAASMPLEAGRAPSDRAGQDVSEVLATCLRGDARQLEMSLTEAFGFPASTEWRVLQIGRHLLLALALKALGLTDREATRIFLTLHPALSRPLSALRELVREMRDVPGPVALALVEAILNVRTPPK